MSQNSKTLPLFLIAIALIGAALPVFHYWYYIGRVPSVSPMPMVEKFLGSGGDYVLIDVRSKEEFESGHIRDAENWQYDEIMSIKSLNDIPERFRGKSLYLVCNSGIRSALAAQSLRKNFSVDAFNVAGGLEACLAYDMPCG